MFNQSVSRSELRQRSGNADKSKLESCRKTVSQPMESRQKVRRILNTAELASELILEKDNPG
jgi:hypothetical protein